MGRCHVARERERLQKANTFNLFRSTFTFTLNNLSNQFFFYFSLIQFEGPYLPSFNCTGIWIFLAGRASKLLCLALYCCQWCAAVHRIKANQPFYDHGFAATDDDDVRRGVHCIIALSCSDERRQRSETRTVAHLHSPSESSFQSSSLFQHLPYHHQQSEQIASISAFFHLYSIFYVLFSPFSLLYSYTFP